MDLLTINQLKIQTHIGVHAWEQAIAQSLLVSVQFPVNCAQVEDQLKNTLNYDELSQAIIEFGQTRSYQLLESFTHDLALELKQRFGLESVTLTVKKPFALKLAAGVEITLTR